MLLLKIEITPFIYELFENQLNVIKTLIQKNYPIFQMYKNDFVIKINIKICNYNI